MGLKKGQTNNPNGRKPGTKNKVTADLRSWVTSFISGQTSQIEKDWKRLEPQQRIILFERLLKYSLPTLQSTHLTTDLDKISSEQVDELFHKIVSNGTK